MVLTKAVTALHTIQAADHHTIQASAHHTIQTSHSCTSMLGICTILLATQFALTVPAPVHPVAPPIPYPCPVALTKRPTSTLVCVLCLKILPRLFQACFQAIDCCTTQGAGGELSIVFRAPCSLSPREQPQSDLWSRAIGARPVMFVSPIRCCNRCQPYPRIYIFRACRRIS